MKKLFAVLAALVLALTGLMAVSASAESPETVSVKMSLNGDALLSLVGASDETMVKRINAVADLVNNLGITVVTDGVDSEVTLSLQDKDMLGFAVLKDDDKVLILSDVFPSYTLSISGEDLGGGLPKIEMDQEKMAKALEGPVSRLSEELASRAGEPEAVSETFFGTAFTEKKVINITTKELVLLLLNTGKEILSDESVASVLAQLKQSGMSNVPDAASLDETISQFENSNEADMPVLDAAVYSNEAGDTIVHLNLSKDGDSLLVQTGSIGGGAVLNLDVFHQLTMVIKGDANGNATIAMDFAPQSGMLVSINGTVSTADITTTADFDISLNSNRLLTLNVVDTKSGALSGRFGSDSNTVLTVSDLSNTGSEKYQGFMQEIQAGLVNVLSQAMQAVPSILSLIQ